MSDKTLVIGCFASEDEPGKVYISTLNFTGTIDPERARAIAERLKHAADAAEKREKRVND